MRRVTVIPGDGIGPDLVAVARRVIEASGTAIAWEEVDAGETAFARYGQPLPPETLASVRRTGVVLKGPMTVPPQGYASPNRALYRAFQAYAQVRLAYHFPGARAGQPGTAITIVRELTEGLGRGAQDQLGPSTGFAVQIITREASARIARFGFDYARARGLRRVTVPHQAAILRATDGLFVRAVREVAEAYPDLELREEAMDALCLRLVKRPQDYEMLLTDALYGGILAGLCAGLAGSVGLMPGCNSGPAVAIFEAGHGSAPHYAGQNKANPVGVVLSGALLLEHIGEARAAARVWKAVRAVIREGRFLTYDLGGSASTAEIAEALIQAVRAD
ncbi:MAG: isocitrate/isopropylmalate dehydrogenase family protein [Chloroflexi bacterium]|nr:isocitrate/isopropylmalate dehydrogenase family protein [Chloroflexota bacterium]